MKISEVLSIDKVVPELKGNTKTEIIDELIELFKDDERVLDIEKVKSAVYEREKIMSTGVGHGFGIPHCKTNAVTEIIAAFGKTKKPVEFDALDGEPVNMVFLLIGKDNLVAAHIKLLSKISHMMNKPEFREKILVSKTAEEIYSLFIEEEKNIT